LSGRVVVLRPEPGASATVKKARAMGLDAAKVPLFEIEPVAWEAPDPADFDGLLLTSASAVRMAGDQLNALRGLPVHAVGEATAEAAREADLEVVTVGNAGIDALLDSLPFDLKLLHLCGEDRREPSGAPQVITPVVVYRAKAIDAPDLSAIEGAVVLVHSPRAGRRLSELVRERGSVAIAAISAAAAKAGGTGWERIEAADAPNDEALLALAARLCNKPPPQ
jgi:uroporphyrinogen-III synthase